VAGERAFPQTDMNVLLSAKSSGKVRALPGHISQGLQEIIAKAMAVKTVDRYATAAHMEKDLDKTYRSLTDKTLSGYAVLENLVNRFEK
jgi:hypothetical protein